MELRAFRLSLWSTVHFLHQASLATNMTRFTSSCGSLAPLLIFCTFLQFFLGRIQLIKVRGGSGQILFDKGSLFRSNLEICPKLNRLFRAQLLICQQS